MSRRTKATQALKLAPVVQLKPKTNNKELTDCLMKLYLEPSKAK